jgi:hypothetical protein
MTSAAKPPLKVMLSSTVYGYEWQIEQIYAILKSMGYKVWNSHKGSLPIVFPASTYGSCIAAVEQCDIFFGLINPTYGSGTDGKGGPSITHLELQRAIELGKPRFILAHENVVLARRLLMDLSLWPQAKPDAAAQPAPVVAPAPNAETKAPLPPGAKPQDAAPPEPAPPAPPLTLKKGASIINDLRLIEMYEAATQEHVPIPDRSENWVQKFHDHDDVLVYIEEQFSRYDDLEAFVELSRQKGGAA